MNYQGKFLGLHIFHHSNGQDANEFNPDGTINLYNGNFSEFVIGELILGSVKEFYSQNSKQYSDTGKKQKSKTLEVPTHYHTPFTEPNRMEYYKAGFEYHDKSITDSAFLAHNLYGRFRLNLQGGYSLTPSSTDIILGKDSVYYAVTPVQSKESWRFVLNISYILDPVYNSGDEFTQTPVNILNLSKRANFNLTAYCRSILASPNAALFLQVGYYGSDPYNIYFQQSFWQIRAGLALAFFKYPTSGDLQKTVYNME